MSNPPQRGFAAKATRTQPATVTVPLAQYDALKAVAKAAREYLACVNKASLDASGGMDALLQSTVSATIVLSYALAALEKSDG